MKTKEEIKQLWLTALKSGEYTFCRGGPYYNEKKNCVVGVLINVLVNLKLLDTEEILKAGDSNIYKALSFVLPDAKQEQLCSVYGKLWKANDRHHNYDEAINVINNL